MIVELNVPFTREEKIEFLTKLDYQIVDLDIDVWEQWGNHDSQGNWQTQTLKCAVKNGIAPTKNDKLDDVFEDEMTKKVKRILLN